MIPSNVMFACAVCLLLPMIALGKPMVDLGKPMVDLGKSASAIGRPIRYRNCGPDNMIKSVTLSPCPEEPCTFHKGQNASVGIDFLSKVATSAVTTKVYGIVLNVPVYYPIPKENGCVGCNMTCPIQSGEYWYLNTLPVLPSYPDIRLVVRWKLVDGQGQDIVCFEFPMAIIG